MGAVTLLALASGRSRAAIPALCAGASVLLLIDPGLAADPGFALSVAATAAIVLLAPSWAAGLRDRGCPVVVADALAVSAAAGMATAPVVAGLSGTVSLVSLPANLLAAPAVAPATVLGLLAAVVGVLVPPLGDALVWLAGWPVRWLVLVGQRAADVPDGATGWPAGSAGAVLLTMLLLLAAWALWRFPVLRPLALAAVVGLVVLGWPLRQAVRAWPPAAADVVACDVGQGDALVVPTGPAPGPPLRPGPSVGQGAPLAAPPGPDAGLVTLARPAVRGLDGCLRRLGIEALPLILLSHLDADHAGGLAGALTGRDVGIVATGTLSPADDRVDALNRLVRRAGASRAVLVPGDRRTVGTASVEVLAPAPERATPGASPNDLSMVVRVTSRGVRVLFTGDLGADAESRILSAGVNLRTDVLKVPHHGSADADPEFLAASEARVALVSVGADNTYGHPAARTLTRLTRAGMQIHRTDREGDLAVAGSAGSWGVAARGSPGGGGMAAQPETTATLGWAVEGPREPRRPVARQPPRQCSVTPCRRARKARRAHITPARGDRGGGAPAFPRGRGRPSRGLRSPP